MNSSFFAALLLCSNCAHAVELHGSPGCEHELCHCSETRESVIASSVNNAILESEAEHEAMRQTFRRRD